MMEQVPTEDDTYPAPEVDAAVLSNLAAICEPDAALQTIIEQCSVGELLRLLEGGIFLAISHACDLAKTTFASRVAGKRADQLRELLGAADDFGSAQERAAATTACSKSPLPSGGSCVAASPSSPLSDPFAL